MSIPDNYDIWCEHQAGRDREMLRLPECSVCGKRITEDFLYYMDGVIYCEDCMNDEYRRPTDDFIED